jgi:predicted alpha/beta-hydrolase family hydrolase
MTGTWTSIDTPVGPARVVREGGTASGLLVLGHGAGRGVGVEAPDLLAARDAGLAVGLEVVRVEQPWLVAGRSVAEAPSRLDAAWLAVIAAVVVPRTPGRRGPLVVGGRSSGARVACRTASAVSADAVLALAFPLEPPGRPDRSRLPELLAPDVPRLVVQGDRDAFGVPPASPGVAVHRVAGADHAFGVRLRDGRGHDDIGAELRDVLRRWLAQVVSSGPGAEGG